MEEADKNWSHFVPLDCDEFIALKEEDDTLSFDLKSILAEFSEPEGASDALVIGGSYYNIPERLDYYYYYDAK